MSFYAEYPQQRYMLPGATIKRAVMLPGDIRGTLLVKEGQRVEVTTIVARGQLPSRHHIIEAAKQLRLRNPEDLTALLQMQRGDVVVEGDVLAGRNPNRGRRVRSPVEGIVAGIENGRIIVREKPEEIDLEAGIQGFVVEARPWRGVVIQGVGGVLQGVWGNNRRAIGALRFEPDDGLELIEGDEIGLTWRGAIVVTREPLSLLGLQVMEGQDIAGVIAPSMDITLLDAAISMNRAIILTEGFGDAPMSYATRNYLTEMIENNLNVRGTLDAVTPNPMRPRRPEMLISVPYREGQEPRPPRTVDRLRPNMTVRLTGEPYNGQTATIQSIPNTPQQIEGGMRVPAVVVELAGGGMVTVPIANLEVFAG